MPSAGEDELPVVDEVLAEALTAQGAPVVRALGLLLDTRRILTGTLLERPAEVAESCLRGAADALLSLPGAPVAVGLKSAAVDLLAAVDALPNSGPPDAPADEPVADPDGSVPVGKMDTVGCAPAAELPEPAATTPLSAGPPADASAGGAVRGARTRRSGRGYGRRPTCCAGSWRTPVAITGSGRRAIRSRPKPATRN